MLYRHTITFAGPLPLAVYADLAVLGFTGWGTMGAWEGTIEPSMRLVCISTQADLRGVARRIAREASQTCVLYERDTLDRLSGLVHHNEPLPANVSEYIGGYAHAED